MSVATEKLARSNPGWLMRFELGGLKPAAPTGLLALAGQRRSGRLAILLGQAGNRADVAMERLAKVAVAAKPYLVVVKELAGCRRGRGESEVRYLVAWPAAFRSPSSTS